jgi:gliding motility-associated-like protein
MQLVAVKNAVSSNLNVTITQKDRAATHTAPPMSLSDTPAAVFDFAPSGTRFAKAIDLTMLYFDNDNNGKVDYIENSDGVANTIDPITLRVFYWDGFNWRLAAMPTINTTDHTVTCKIDHFSEYALFPVATLTPEDYRPKMKIITPNGDGVNDEADFNSLTEEIKIFDITGRKIRSVSAGTGKWDGKDDGGTIVESGVYIYQFTVDGTLVSGVIAVAK